MPSLYQLCHHHTHLVFRNRWLSWTAATWLTLETKEGFASRKERTARLILLSSRSTKTLLLGHKSQLETFLFSLNTSVRFFLTLFCCFSYFSTSKELLLFSFCWLSFRSGKHANRTADLITDKTLISEDKCFKIEFKLKGDGTLTPLSEGPWCSQAG